MAPSPQVFKTALTELVGIAHPIIQGGMHYVGYAPLAAAVSEAGGLGMITALTQPDAKSLELEIQKARSLTSKPLGVNLTLLPTLVPPNYEDFARVVVDAGIECVETAGHYKGLEPFVETFKKNDIPVIHKCTQIRHGQTAAKMGVDMISVDGFECAGHPGEADVGNWILLAQAYKELGIPFVASGGVGTGSQLAAALAFGASGVNLGTRFMATNEAPIHANIKQALVDGGLGDTTLVMRSVRNTERVYKNDAATKVQDIEAAHPGDFSKIAHLVKGDIYRRAFQETGSTTEGIWSAGQVMGLIDSVVSCEELIDGMVAEAAERVRAAESTLV